MDAFKDLVWDLLVKAAIEKLFIAVPFLAIWPIGPIVTVFLTLFGDRIYAAAHETFDLGAIVFKNDLHKITFQKSDATLKIIAHDKGIDSKEFEDARDNALEAMSKFTHFAG